ncbi:glycerate kinase [Trueperella sp. LYQ141]|uniref:glycerate kinase n=1 Tax=Trueperella sp. LYQ141 TaxID=3391058 RepID=UPI003983D3D1
MGLEVSQCQDCHAGERCQVARISRGPAGATFRLPATAASVNDTVFVSDKNRAGWVGSTTYAPNPTAWGVSMKIVLAPDSFKESLSASEAAKCMRRAVKQVWPDAQCCEVPMADGGEGTMAAIVSALGGEVQYADVHDALGRARRAEFGWVAGERLAIVEVAQTIGIEHIAREERDPHTASTFGLGELLAHVLSYDPATILVGLGGSATNDGGWGMCHALGVRAYDDAGLPLPPYVDALARAVRVDIAGVDPRWAAVSVKLACDVANPLTGANGASAIFGPQKGVAPEEVADFDAILARWATLVESQTGVVCAERAGAGAAGGLGFAFMSVFAAHSQPGVELVMDTVGLRDALVGADLVFTGEGSIDGQTREGKTPWGVMQAAYELGIPTIAFAGRVGADAGALYATAARSATRAPSATEAPSASGQGKAQGVFPVAPDNSSQDLSVNHGSYPSQDSSVSSGFSLSLSVSPGQNSLPNLDSSSAHASSLHLASHAAHDLVQGLVNNLTSQASHEPVHEPAHPALNEPPQPTFHEPPYPTFNAPAHNPIHTPPQGAVQDSGLSAAPAPVFNTDVKLASSAVSELALAASTESPTTTGAESSVATAAEPPVTTGAGLPLATSPELPANTAAGQPATAALEVAAHTSQHAPRRTPLTPGFTAIVPIVREVCDLPTALECGETNLYEAVTMTCRLLSLLSDQ